MTVVNVTALRTLLGSPGPIPRGSVIVDYWAGSSPYTAVDGDTVTFPATITVPIVDGELEEPLELEPTGGLCCARVMVLAPGRSITRFVEIPDVGPVDFGDLPVVDPVAFVPVAPTATLLQQLTAALRDRF
jgi:hypothetical protein